MIGTRQLKGGAWLYMFIDNTYTIVFPDGKTETGTFEFKDGMVVFTGKAGKVCTPTMNDEGNFEYTYVRKDGKEISFTLSKTFTARTIRAAEKV